MPPRQRVKKVRDFFARYKRHIFYENKFSRKISLRSSKSLMAQAFLMAIIQLEAGLFSLRLGHGAALICHRHIIHYRTATSLPLAQGSLWGGVTAGWLLEYHITVITLSKNDMSKKRFFCVTHN